LQVALPATPKAKTKQVKTSWAPAAGGMPRKWVRVRRQKTEDQRHRWSCSWELEVGSWEREVAKQLVKVKVTVEVSVSVGSQCQV